MLSTDDESAIERVLEEFARRGQTGAAETAALLSRLPARPEVLDHLVGRAKMRGLPWVEYLARTVSTLGAASQAAPGTPAPPPPPMPITGAQLSTILASSEPYPRKVEALLAALRARHPELPQVIRKHLVGETDPFVTATLASALGQCGTALDGAILAPLLNHPDNRVVANALDALRRLKAPPRAEVLVRLLESPDQRVRTNAIAFLGVLDPDRALELVRALVYANEPITRAGVAFVLGELVERPGATELLLEMNDREENMVVLKQIALSLKKHSGPDTAQALVGALHSAAQNATGAKRSVVGTTLHEIAVEAGMVSSEVERLGSEYRAKHGAPAPAPQAPPPAALHAAVPFSPVASARVDSSAQPGARPLVRPAGRTTTAAFATMPPPPAPASRTTASFAVQRPAATAPAEIAAAEPASPVDAKVLAPTAAPAEEEEELSFASVWGAPQAPAAADPSTSTGAIKLPGKSTGRSGMIPQPSQRIPLPDAPAAPRGMAWGWLAAGVLVLAVTGAMFVPGLHTEPEHLAASAATKAPRKSRVAGTVPVATTQSSGQNPIAAHLGPAGAPVSVNGRVVGITAGRPVIECQGQYYLVVKGARRADEITRGQMLSFAGKIMGSSEDGLFYVEENVR